MTTRVYDSSQKRELQDWEIKNQSYPLRKDSRYYASLIEYKDPNNKVQEDLERMPADLQKLMDTWKDSDSFNRRTAEALFQKMLAKYLTSVARNESGAYVKIKHRRLKTIKKQIMDALPLERFAS